MQEHLDILGYSQGARPESPAELKKRWKDLCRKHHPDHGGDDREFIKVTHAYRMLTDPDYRTRSLHDEARRKDGNRFGDLSIKVHVPLTFDAAFFGQRVVVSYNRWKFDEDLNPILTDQFEVEAVTIDIPAGSVSGYEKAIPGGGHRRGDSVGDAVILFIVQPHAVYTVRGVTVQSKHRIDLITMLKGGSIEVPTMYGLKTVRVPPGSTPGSTLTIKNCGVGEAGDHVVSVEPIYPTQGQLKTDDWKGLGITWTDEAPDKEEEEHVRRFREIMAGRGMQW